MEHENSQIEQLKITAIDEDFNFEGEREDTTFAIHMFAGSIAGLMEHVAMYPIDTIKVYFVYAN